MCNEAPPSTMYTPSLECIAKPVAVFFAFVATYLLKKFGGHPCSVPFVFCGEVLVIRPHLLSESAQGYLLLNLREDEGQEEVLEDKDEEEEESEVDEKV